MTKGDAQSVNSPPAKSPCVSICKLDPKGEFCIGCGRTLAQIAAAGAGTGASASAGR